jgi:hypothetical protein
MNMHRKLILFLLIFTAGLLKAPNNKTVTIITIPTVEVHIPRDWQLPRTILAAPKVFPGIKTAPQ